MTTIRPGEPAFRLPDAGYDAARHAAALATSPAISSSFPTSAAGRHLDDSGRTVELVQRFEHAFPMLAPRAVRCGAGVVLKGCDIVLAAVLVVVAFGRSGGKRLVDESSVRARELHADQHA